MGPEGGGVKKYNSGKQLKQSGYPHADPVDTRLIT